VAVGATNTKYRYVNDTLDNIANTGSYAGVLYSHWLYMEKKSSASGSASQVIKVGLRELIRK